jgi:hypothetical protein
VITLTTPAQLPAHVAYITFAEEPAAARAEYAKQYPWLAGMPPEYYVKSNGTLYVPVQWISTAERRINQDEGV